MNAWYLICFLSALAILIAFANQYVLKLQTTIAITSGAVLISLLIIVTVKLLGAGTATTISHIVAGLDFNQLLLKGMLGFLLFAGALEIDLRALRNQRWEITVLVLFSTVFSTFMIGYLSYWLLALVGWPVPFVYCLLFGALISPTDPIAVLAIIKQMNAPKGISIQVEGESLFNDGMGLVIFTTIYAVAFAGVEPTFESVTKLFVVDAAGGIMFGFILALIGHFLAINSKDGNIRLLVTLIFPTAGFALANMLEISGALAMVTCGIILGNITRSVASKRTGLSATRYVKNFWHAVDNYLNALLFLLIGLLLVTIPLSMGEILLGVMMVPVVLLARFISVSIPYLGFRRFRRYDPYSISILTWGGLRGGLALAMAASVPTGVVIINGTDLHGLMVIMTYVVAVFSIIVQGGTISPLINRSMNLVKQSASSMPKGGEPRADS